MDLAYVVFSRHKKGAKKFHRLASLHRMVDEHRLTLSVEVMRWEGSTAGTVRRLPWWARQRSTHISSIIVERGFYSVYVRDRQATGMLLVMPAVKLARIKGAIKEHAMPRNATPRPPMS